MKFSNVMFDFRGTVYSKFGVCDGKRTSHLALGDRRIEWKPPRNSHHQQQPQQQEEGEEEDRTNSSDIHHTFAPSPIFG